MISYEIKRFSRIVGGLGKSEFGSRIDEFLRASAPFDMTCIFAFRADAAPVLMYDGYSASVSRHALDAYLRGGYLLDPFYVACTSDVPDGLRRMSDIAPDEFFASDFAASREVHPCISDESGTLIEEIGYLVTLPDGWRATYSLMRNHTSVPFSQREFDELAELAEFIGGLIQRHAELAPVASPDPRAAAVESILQRAFEQKLTPAQFRVVNLILRGHSSQSIARELHITEGTAKLHRHNAYQRLGITSQSELFRVFIDFLERD